MLSIAMYLAHLQGTSVSKLASDLSVSEEWATERIEAGRLCVEHQVCHLEFRA